MALQPSRPLTPGTFVGPGLTEMGLMVVEGRAVISQLAEAPLDEGRAAYVAWSLPHWHHTVGENHDTVIAVQSGGGVLAGAEVMERGVVVGVRVGP